MAKHRKKNVPEARTVTARDAWGVERVVGGHGGEVGAPPRNPDAAIEIEEERPDGLLLIDFARPILVTPRMLGEIEAALDETSKDDPDRAKLAAALLAERSSPKPTEARTYAERCGSEAWGGKDHDMRYSCTLKDGHGGTYHRDATRDGDNKWPVTTAEAQKERDAARPCSPEQEEEAVLAGTRTPSRNCPDCDVKPGEHHAIGCDVERCARCGGQRISCSCATWARQRHERKHGGRLPWSGLWPGTVEAREYGMTLGAPDPDDGLPMPDLNRLVTECVWDRKARRFVRRADDGGR